MITAPSRNDTVGGLCPASCIRRAITGFPIRDGDEEINGAPCLPIGPNGMNFDGVVLPQPC